MVHDPNLSPAGWYSGSYLLRFVELADNEKNDPEKDFLIWENTIVVSATNIDEAYEEIVHVATMETPPYKAGPGEGIDAQWLSEGVTELLPIYEELGDGTEVMWAEYTRKLLDVRKLTRSKSEWLQRKPTRRTD